jgi:hypothetical protein
VFIGQSSGGERLHRSNTIECADSDRFSHVDDRSGRRIQLNAWHW